ncbi:MAG: hypothetical protein EXS05_20710 [Planctomycetaceae bacterium]|nr:hypothetical protein [Planctomycetaceae bacterium]
MTAHADSAYYVMVTDCESFGFTRIVSGKSVAISTVKSFGGKVPSMKTEGSKKLQVAKVQSLAKLADEKLRIAAQKIIPKGVKLRAKIAKSPPPATWWDEPSPF